MVWKFYNFPATYSHSQWLFYEFVIKISNKLVKQSLIVTVDFTWNKILMNSIGKKMSFLAILMVLNSNFSHFSNFEPLLRSQIYQNLKLRVSEIAKLAIFEFQILTKLFWRKIEWQIDSWNVDSNFTFWEFLEHCALLLLIV